MSGENGKGSVRRQENARAVRDRWPFEEKSCDSCGHSLNEECVSTCPPCHYLDQWKPK